MDYMTTMEAAAKWDVSPRSVTRYIKAGKVPGAVQKGKSWLIPQTAERPRDGRDRKRPATNILPVSCGKVDNSFRFPIFFYSRSCNHREVLSPVEQLLYDGQLLWLEGKYPEAKELLQNLLPEIDSLAPYLQLGIWYTLVFVGVGNVDIQGVQNCKMQIERILQQDFPYKKEMELYYPIVQGTWNGFGSLRDFPLDANYTYHLDAFSVLVVRYIYQYATEFSKTFRFRQVDLAFLSSMVNIFESEGREVLALLMHIGMNYVCTYHHDKEGSDAHLKKAVDLARRNNAPTLLMELMHTLGNRFTKALTATDKKFNARMLHIWQCHMQFFTAMANARNRVAILDLFSGTELYLLYGVAMGYTNLQLAEYHQVTASTISKRLNVIYEKAGIKKRSEVRDYVLRVTKGIYTED